MNINLKENIKDILLKVCLLEYYNDEKLEYYKTDIYTDYRDKLDESDLKRIIDSEQPKDMLQDILCDNYMDYIAEVQQEITATVSEHLYLVDVDFDEGDIATYIQDVVVFEYPIEYYLNQAVNVTLTLDMDESNYDFTCNNKLTDSSSIIWLCRQQGYTKRRIRNAINYYHYGNSKFLESMHEEALNVTTSCNLLTFLFNMSLGELIELKSSIELKKDIKISKDTTCGLVDFCQGGGSLLNICLEKDVLVPAEYVYDLAMDGNSDIGYGVDQIYGLVERCWTKGSIVA